MDIEGLKDELRRRALMADDNMGDSEAFDNAANAIDQLQRNMRENLQREAKDYNELLAEKERIERELEEARKDAERYCWLKTCDDWIQFQGYAECEPEALDAAIDAAREKQG